MAGQGKQWCFTLNNYSDEEYNGITERAVANATYCIVGKEVGEGGTPHLQGYIILKKRERLAGVKAIVGGRCHLEQAKGTPGDNRNYCSKEGSYWEHGQCPASNNKKRTRDEIAVDFYAAVEREDLDSFKEANPGVWAFDGARLCRNYFEFTKPIERPDIRVIWLCGKPGVGKSRLAHELLPTAYLKDPRTKWWNGYRLERTVIMDDFGKLGIDLNHLLRWFDRYKCLVEVKGAMMPLFAQTFIVTSNFHPIEAFTDDNGRVHAQIDALLRRVEVVEGDTYEQFKEKVTL